MPKKSLVIEDGPIALRFTRYTQEKEHGQR
jgi:hypothetical protein